MLINTMSEMAITMERNGKMAEDVEANGDKWRRLVSLGKMFCTTKSILKLKKIVSKLLMHWQSVTSFKF